MKLLITAVSEPVWRAFCGWYQTRGLPPPGVIPKDSIFVITETGELVAGCCIFPTDGPIAVVEFMSTSPYLPARLCHMATWTIGQNLIHYGAMRGKTILCHVTHQGLRQMLLRAGFGESGAIVLHHVPLAETGMDFQLGPAEPPPQEDVRIEKPKIPRKRAKTPSEGL